MPRWLPVLLVIVMIASAALGTAVCLSIVRWNHATERTRERLRAQRPVTEMETARYTRRELVGLPAPVARYFSFALTDGQWLIRHATLTQTGTFAMRRDAW